MTRLTNTDVNSKVDHAQGADAPVQGKPEAARESIARQANKGILSEAVAQELNVPRRTAARVLDAVLDSIQDLLRSRGKVAVKGFGTFERKIRKPEISGPRRAAQENSTELTSRTARTTLPTLIGVTLA